MMSEEEVRELRETLLKSFDKNKEKLVEIQSKLSDPTQRSTTIDDLRDVLMMMVELNSEILMLGLVLGEEGG